MRLSVKVIGHLLDYLPNEGANFVGRNYQIGSGATLAALAADMGLPSEAEYFVMVNGNHVTADRWAVFELNEPDAVVFCPPLKGG